MAISTMLMIAFFGVAGVAILIMLGIVLRHGRAEHRRNGHVGPSRSDAALFEVPRWTANPTHQIPTALVGPGMNPSRDVA